MNNILIYPLSQRISFLFKFPRINLKIFWVLSFVLIAALLFIYIFQTSVLISETYYLQNYQKKFGELSEQSKVLEIELSKINYLENLAPKVQELGLEKTDAIHYIQVVTSRAAELAAMGRALK